MCNYRSGYNLDFEVFYFRNTTLYDSSVALLILVDAKASFARTTSEFQI